MWLISEGDLTESSGIAIINERTLRLANDKGENATDHRYDPRRWDFEVQIGSDLGAATGVDIHVMGPTGAWALWTTTPLTADQIAVISVGFYREIRLTWNGGDGTSDGASFWATPKFNGLVKG